MTTTKDGTTTRPLSPATWLGLLILTAPMVLVYSILTILVGFGDLLRAALKGVVFYLLRYCSVCGECEHRTSDCPKLR